MKLDSVKKIVIDGLNYVLIENDVKIDDQAVSIYQ